ncbi:MAG: tRNA preQ1(34) S-adenosylmethionine ribosyltransferase-isomerase QueA [Acetanaerobacterium sp.]
MKKSEFWYTLPDQLIAQTPIEPRDASRMLVLDRKTGEMTHLHFCDITALLHRGDTLILNDTRVLPARLYGKRVDTGGDIEFLLLEQKEDKLWEILVRPGKRARTGHRFVFGDGLLTATIEEVLPDGNRLARFVCDGSIYTVLEQIGLMPLPPYIKETLSDRERYQTVYSRELGSAAAPTAGLHFTPALLDTLKQAGVNIGFVTLHVGLGTFRPVKEENITDHKMHCEHYVVPEETANLINRTKADGGRVIAVGTTSCRTLEAAYTTHGSMCACGGSTDIFIYPGYEFKVLDGLITNFHLPESTLIMLVSAFAGYEHTMHAYETAVREQYRFFSFGDAMFIQ